MLSFFCVRWGCGRGGAVSGQPENAAGSAGAGDERAQEEAGRHAEGERKPAIRSEILAGKNPQPATDWGGKIYIFMTRINYFIWIVLYKNNNFNSMVYSFSVNQHNFVLVIYWIVHIFCAGKKIARKGPMRVSEWSTL